VKPIHIVDRLDIVIGLDGPPRRLSSVIEQELISHFGLPAIQAAEQAERFEPAVAKLIRNRQFECEQNGTIAALTLLGSSANSVAGCCFVQSSDSAAVAQLKAHRVSSNPILSKLQQLNFAEFELFGSKVLRELGARKTHVTPHSNDQGIDFYGILKLGELQGAPLPFFHLAHDVEIRFAGQAKHHPNKPVGTDVVRELAGAVSLARFKTYSTDEDLFEELSLNPLSPLVVLLFATGKLTSGTIDLAAKAGIVARSGEQLSVFLADRGVGMVTTAGMTTFDSAKFDEWLHAA
jgi:hypothetical protein